MSLFAAGLVRAVTDWQAAIAERQTQQTVPPTLLRTRSVVDRLPNELLTTVFVLTIDDSFVAWNNVAWYGHFLVAGALVFFYCGGSGLIQEIQATRRRNAKFRQQREELNRMVQTGAITPTSNKSAPTLPPIDEAAQEIERELMGKGKDKAE